LSELSLEINPMGHGRSSIGIGSTKFLRLSALVESSCATNRDPKEVWTGDYCRSSQQVDNESDQLKGRSLFIIIALLW
jgi:hypothetical protein